MRFTKLQAYILAALLALLSLPLYHVSAEEVNNDSSAWDGEAFDISWYDDEEKEFHLSTTEELAGVSYLSRNGDKTFKDMTVFLDNDIDMNNKEWTAISYFAGTLDGNKHCIKNIKPNFGFVYENSGVITNLDITNFEINQKEIELVSKVDNYNTYIGAICAKSHGIINNCSASGVINYSENGEYKPFVKERHTVEIGGIAGYAGGQIINCRNDCEINVHGNDEFYASNTHSLLPPLAHWCIGGIGGYSEGVKIIQCKNNGKINSTFFSVLREETASRNIFMNIGGIGGFISSGTLKECCNTGDIVINDDSRGCGQKHLAGGLVGNVNSQMTYYNYFMARNERKNAKTVIEGCYNSGSISYNLDAEFKGNGCVCGLIGNMYYGEYSILNRVYNTGAIKGDDVSGLVGELNNVNIVGPACYYLNTIATGATNWTRTEGIAKSKSNMTQFQFLQSLGTSFAYVENDYPKLAWELGIIYGDINSDGTADIADVVLLQKALLTETELDSKVAELADLDFNGIINAVDLTLLKRMIIDELL